MRRVLAVGFVPQAVCTACLCALLRAGALTGRADWSRVLPSDPAAAAGLLAAVCAGAALLGLAPAENYVRAGETRRE